MGLGSGHGTRRTGLLSTCRTQVRRAPRSEVAKLEWWNDP